MFFKIEPTEAAGMSPMQLSATARRVLASLLAHHYGLSPLPQIAVAKNGKPYFPAHPEIHFSLSHCNKAVMAAVDSSEIGCDIEELQKDFSWELLDVAFSEREKSRILASPTPERELTALWTRKEAVVKRDGEIPDSPATWSSEDSRVFTRILPEAGYAFSIATSATN